MSLKSLTEIGSGIFTGLDVENTEGERFPVPPNYISKSKLVEGDEMKIYLTDDGRTVFKQVFPVKRIYTRGKIIRRGSNWTVSVKDKSYFILPASGTFFQLETGDDVAVIIAAEGDPQWAAIENVIKNQDIDKEF